ncbi:MAG: lamin tail domain-containing protein [Cyclobacteriaceae bacterium]|nr:lamin tail domain-containing protein [Cyclobacteriaceae bacterium]
MKAFLKIAIVFIAVIPSYGQWNEDFSDGNFTNNPTWQGSTVDFLVESEVLRLSAPAISATSYLSTPSDISLEAQWDFWVKLDFNPSSSNYMKVYLISDTEDLTHVTNGYFIKIGGTTDEISFYKVVDGSETLLIDGADGRVDLAVVEASVAVTRDASGLWEVKSKLPGETSFVSEGTVTDQEVQKSNYFGIACTYTSTRSDKMYMDDISVTGNPFVDMKPPKLLSYSTPASNQIQLVFNEPLDPIESKNVSHYLLNNSDQPNSTTLMFEDTVVLAFDNVLELTNTLSISNLPDVAGNQLDTLLNVFYIDPSPHEFREVVFNELFPDPDPSIGLPTYEFVELFNNSDRIINLEGWGFTDGSSVATLPNQLLFPDSLLILCPEQAAALYEGYGTTIGLSTWPTLNNTGDSLKLIDDQGKTIDSLAYTSGWYNDAAKDDGGWTLELINPDSKCKGRFNWRASSDPIGGTPGQTNSLFNPNGDEVAPMVREALVENDSLMLWLSEPIVQGSYQGIILPDQINVAFSVSEPVDYVITPMTEPLSMEKTYTIETLLEDCAGNSGTAASSLFPIAQPEQGNIVINELLFNPYSGGSDFVEVLNITPYYFNLQDFTIANETTQKLVSDSVLLLGPKHYLAFSEDILFLKNQYLAPDSSLFETDLPTMPNDEGIVLLRDDSGITLDSVYYSEDYHFSLLEDVEGISLERVSPAEDSNNPDNWKSAAQTVGYATPGYANSQSEEVTSEGKVTVNPQVITPNNDGQADYCQITFELSGSDKVMSVNIYNLNGQLIKTLANNVLISPQGFFTWDGTDEHGSPLPTAHYIIVSEIVGSDGRTQRFRSKVVVANGF